MTSISIQSAQASDAPTIAELTEELGYEVSVAETERRLTGILDDDDHAVFVARLGDEVIGWVHVAGMKRLEATFFAELGGLVVKETARRHGVGRRLVEAATRWARDAGYRTLRVRSNVVRPEAPRFYESVGFSRVKDQQVFARKLSGGR